MSEPLLIDTDVLIDYLRGQADAATYLEELSAPLLMSVITLAELFAGVRDGEERRALDVFISVFELVEVSSEIENIFPGSPTLLSPMKKHEDPYEISAHFVL